MRPVGLVAGGSLFAALLGCREAPPRLVAPAAGARLGGETLAVEVRAPGSYAVTFDGVGHGRGPVPLEHVADGPHRLAVRDAAGRVHDEREIYIDRTPPAVRLLRPGPVLPYGLVPGQTVEVVVDVTDASPPVTLTHGEPRTPDADGRYRFRVVLGPNPLTVEVSARDGVGNRASARVEAAPGLVQWQAPMPLEAGAWTAERLTDDAVLLAFGEAAAVIGPDGRERFGVEVDGHVLAEARGLPDDGALLRLLHPVNPGAARVERVEPDGRRIPWSRPESIPLALGVHGKTPFVAWRTPDGPVLTRAPLPWPPAAPTAADLPCEPRALRSTPDGAALLATCSDRLLLLDEAGAVRRDVPLEPGDVVATLGSTVFVGGPNRGLESFSTAGEAAPMRLDAAPVRAMCGLTSPAGGRLAVVGLEGTVRRDPDGRPVDGPVTLPRDVAVDPTACAGWRGERLYPLDGPSRVLPGPIVGARRIGERHLVVLAGEPPSALVVGPGEALETMALTPLATANRVVALPDGLLVTGPAAARPDRGLGVRLTLASDTR